MNGVLILLAGYPGTGKTFLSNIIKKKLGGLVRISPDDIKEDYFDRYGFRNIKEKQQIERIAWEKYYEIMEKQMKRGNGIISDYPFSSKQKTYLEKLSGNYNYKVITIRLIADLDILYERQQKRDLDPTRHLSHIVNSYKKGDYLTNREKADNLLTYEEFIERCKTRGYNTFNLGRLFEVDVTDYTNVNYTDLIDNVETYLSLE
ncbi:Zeta toxin [Niallia circulans]|jgi:predicted kinase|uniref:Kinase n=3 Tax=Niallia circulans TaxID=1397 RepID=A0A0J1I7Y2_NIACI|nr:AAA family ATPase [Niallia circulans]KLV22054.1 kinase [Niallia circulans]MDR4316496.1 ATP-binding protein [Niallia circulans]MED3838331.1 AAA family ATPase [Niallia circulans]MED4243806.1 AAA family ATPase [Niallia circulans]MED4246198.1 AAA family ATPase [Niallia circulans]